MITIFCHQNMLEFFEQYKKGVQNNNSLSRIISESFINASLNALSLDNTAFNAAYGYDQNKTGHGIYAEKTGVILDRVELEKSSHVGSDNALNGPDKIVNGMAVQCKYCNSANASINNCFKTDKITGEKSFRYYDLNGNPMQIEVPKDQYEKAVENFREKILAGEVKGIHNSKEAENIIRKGKLTYKQVKNIAKAGTFESLVYDAATGAIECTAICGISALVSFGITYWKTGDKKRAAEVAFYTGIEVFGISFMGHILAAQIARTSIPNILKPAAAALSKQLDYALVQNVVNCFRAIAGKPQIYGAAAQKAFAKALRVNVITQSILFIVFEIPDTYNLIWKKMTGAQYTKNMVSSLMGIVGGIAGAAAGFALAEIGEKIGKKPGKGIGGVVGAVGAAAGGIIASASTKKIGDCIVEDDAIITTRMFNAVVANSCIDYLLSEKEVDELIEMFNHDSRKLIKFQKEIIASEQQYEDVIGFIKPYFEDIVSKREKIQESMVEELYENMDETMEDFCAEVTKNEV